MKRIAIVTPVFEDAEAARTLFRELAKVESVEFEMVVVEDGSLESPVGAELLTEVGLAGQVIVLKRNLGHQKAIAIGLSYVAENLGTFDYAVVMDSDGEDIPATILDLLVAIEQGDSDVVAATRSSRVETLKFKAFYVGYKLVFRLLVGRTIDFGNFMILSPRAVERVAGMQEVWTHVAATLLASRLRVKRKAIGRGPRYAGRSKMNFVGLALHGFRALMVFPEEVLVRVGMACVALALLVCGLAVVAVGIKAVNMATPGWLSTTLGLLVVLFVQSAGISLMALMNLMLTGAIRGSGVSAFRYKDFVKEIQRA